MLSPFPIQMSEIIKKMFFGTQSFSSQKEGEEEQSLQLKA